MQVRIDSSEDPRLAKILDTVSSIQLKALGRLGRTIERAGLEVVGSAVKRRFTGKGPFPLSENKLGVKTGRLRRSIRSTKAQVNLRTGEISVGFGSNVAYFAIHEFGFQGEVPVKQHSRRTVGQKFNRRGQLTKKTTERMKKNLRAGGSSGTMVRAHRRKLDVKPRAPLGTELKSIRTRAAFILALKKALEPMLRGK